MDIIKPNLFILYKVPIDILNYIASFLIFNDNETEHEFIERTYAITKPILPKKYFSYLPENKNCFLSEIVCSQYCPNNKMLIVLQRFEDYGYNASTLTVINTKNDTIVYEQKENLNNCSHATVSRDGALIALLNKLKSKTKKENDFTDYYQEVLTIKNINEKKEEIIIIPQAFLLPSDQPSFAFNKQGTHIIIHDLNAKQSKNNVLSRHMIFPITINTLSDDHNKKTLEKYFEQKGICKNLLKKITQ